MAGCDGTDSCLSPPRTQHGVRTAFFVPAAATGCKRVPGSARSRNRNQSIINLMKSIYLFVLNELMVGRVGFEPTTNWLKASCSTN